jgi:hypothetical protein
MLPMGRPKSPTPTEQVSVRIPAPLLAQLDAYIAEHERQTTFEITRQTVIIGFLKDGLARRGQESSSSSSSSPTPEQASPAKVKSIKPRAKRS